MRIYGNIILGSGLVIALGYQMASGQAGKQAPPATKGGAEKQSAAANPQQIERGRYMVEIGGCNDCHTAGYADAGGKAAEADRLKGDTLGYRGPWGTTYPSNLRMTISKLSEDDWVKYGKSLMTRPPMPWFNVRAMTEQDLRAVYQYIKSLPGSAGNAAPMFVPPDKQPKPPFVQWPGVK